MEELRLHERLRVAGAEDGAGRSDGVQRLVRFWRVDVLLERGLDVGGWQLEWFGRRVENGERARRACERDIDIRPVALGSRNPGGVDDDDVIELKSLGLFSRQHRHLTDEAVS